MSSPFVAEIRMFACNFAPTGWALCDGQLLPISQNTALFSLLGTFYGGDGKSTFALPDMQGNAPMHQGQGAGLSQRFLGETSGSQTVTLITSEMPAHNHFITGYTDDPAASQVPAPDQFLGNSQGLTPYKTTAAAPASTLGPQALNLIGGSLPHNNMPPILTLTFCIAMQGIFPPRS
jgi:microcystin-dependent protein